MLLQNLNKYTDIVIQVHDNPDADAVGSGYAVYRYFLSLGKNVRLIYGGRNKITKSNILLMISSLEIPLEYADELEKPELLITVDCQYGEGNAAKFNAENVAMIDHHSTGRESDEMCEIRSNLASCATVCYALLNGADFDVNADPKIATALYYGLYMDSNQLSEIHHPLDKDMAEFLKYSKPLVNKFKFANYSLDDLTIAAETIINKVYLEEYSAAIFRAAPCDPNILGVVGDFTIQADCIDLCAVFNDCGNGYKFSVRSCSADALANEFAVFLTEKVGNGGGHPNKAGGFISKSRLEEVYHSVDAESYLCEKINEFFTSYDVVSYTDELDISQFERYRKLSGIYGFVPTEDIFTTGTECKIRTLEGDVSIKADKDIFIAIGAAGGAYPIEKEAFEKRYTKTGKPFTGTFEYFPSVIDSENNKTVSLMPFAKECISHGGSVIYAKPLKKLTKVLTKWDYEGCMKGTAGDWLCCPENDTDDIYIVKKDIFTVTYEKI